VNHFVPRIHPQEEIQKQFQAANANAIPTVVVLLGMGGCGKSQLALGNATSYNSHLLD
jgi:adenylylsulfate kinase-like enzyme